MNVSFRPTLPLLTLLGALLLSLPASAQAPIRIMPLGDSITDGSQFDSPDGTGGYRGPLYNLLVGAGYTIDYVGTSTINSGLLADPDHEGHSGWRIDQLDSNIEGWFGTIADPDVVLMHIGTNDFGQNFNTSTAIDRLDGLITKIATLRPYAYIIVTNILERGEPENTNIQTQFNAFVEDRVDAQALAGRRVTFLDMRSVVPLSDMPDNLHPNQTGYNKMADAWLPAIQAVIGPDGDNFPPAIARARGSQDRTEVEVTFSKPVADSAATVGNFAIDGGLTVSAAVLDADKRVVTLTTTEQTAGTSYTVTVNGVVDRTAGMLALPANSTVDFFAATPRGYLNNVPESAGYTLVYSLEIPNAASYANSGPAYDVDNHNFVGSLTRIAYYLELQNATDDLQYVWASMDAFTTDAGKIGVPTAATGAIFQEAVTGLNVVSNAGNIANTTNASGNIEFWPTNYAQGNAAGVPGASDTLFDFGDTRDGGGLYGSMQVHNTGEGQTIFAFNNWGNSGGAGNADLGIGNDPSTGDGSLDWTFHNNAGGYVVKTLQVLVQAVADTTPPTLVSATSFSDTQIAVRFSEPLAASSIQPADFTLSGGVTVLDATLGANQRDVNLLTTTQSACSSLVLTVSDVTDSSPAANPIAPGSSIAVSIAATVAGIAKLPLSEIIPGTESVTLVTNGDFEDNSSGNGFQPAGWNRFGNMFYDTPSYGVPNDNSQVANYHIDGGGVGNYNQVLNLLPDTEYVLSAYMWHLGNAGANQVGRVELDLNDAFGEPNDGQDGGGSIRIDQTNPEANEGYFVYGTFNTADTGTTPLLRIFMVHGGVTSGWPNQPDGGLWDNVAVTPASSFVPPAVPSNPIAITEILYNDGSDEFTLSWTSVADTTYSVCYSPNLTDWGNPVASGVPTGGASSSFGPFPNPAPGALEGFFRVRED